MTMNAPSRSAAVRGLKWSVIGRQRSMPHLGRKLYHMVCGLICFFLYALVLTRTQALWLLGIFGGLLVTLDILRFRFPVMLDVGLLLFGKIMRREELRSLTGNSFYIVGLFLIALLFPKPIVLLSVLYLAIGDPVAAVVGTTWGKTKLWGKKSLEGALGNFTATSFVTLLMGLFYFQLDPIGALALGIVGGTISMTAELLPLPVDDNLSIPLLSATLLSVLFAAFPIIG